MLRLLGDLRCGVQLFSGHPFFFLFFLEEEHFKSQTPAAFTLHLYPISSPINPLPPKKINFAGSFRLVPHLLFTHNGFLISFCNPASRILTFSHLTVICLKCLQFSHVE